MTTPKTLVERKLKKYREDYARISTELMQLESTIHGLEEALKCFPQEGEPTKQIFRELRPGTELYAVKELLLKEGKPLHMDKIMELLGKDPNKKTSLAGSLNSYVKQGKVFTKKGPSVFGLIEWEINNEGNGL